jgi:hypothetical protein
MSHTKLKIGLGLAALMGLSSVAQAVDYSVSGHVNQMIRYVDDSNTDDTDTQIVDNGTNASRVSLSASGEFAGMDVEVYSQFRWNANNSATTFPDLMGSGGFSSSNNLDAAYLDIAFKHELGTFSIGRGDGAARFTQRQDLSGTELADNFDVRRYSTGDDIRVGFEGHRGNRVRYDAPSIAGLNLSVSADSDGATEVGLTWDSEAEAYSEYMDGLRWIGAIGYINNPDDSFSSTDDRIAASVSALLGGTSLTLGYGEESYEGTDPDADGTYIKLGQRFGNHAFSISLANLDDGFDEVDQTAIGYQYNSDGAVDVYASYSMADPDATLAEDWDQFIVGTRVRF